MSHGRHFISVNGLRLRYVDWGGDGPDLIFVHPTGFVADIWAPFAQRLRDHFHCVALGTRAATATVTSRVMTARGSWSKTLTDSQAGLGSPSDWHWPLRRGEPDCRAGGGTAGDVPGRRADGAGAELRDARSALARASASRHGHVQAPRQSWSSRQEAYDSFRTRPPFQSWDEAPLREYVEHGFADLPDGTVALKCPPETEAQMYAGDQPWLLNEATLRRVRCPVRLRSAESPIFTDHVAARTEALLSDCRLAMLPWTGHFAPFEHVDLALVEVERFLSPLAAEQRSAEDGVR